MGIVIPREIASERRLRAGDEVIVEIEPAGIEEAFGSLKDWDVDPQELKDAFRRSR